MKYGIVGRRSDSASIAWAKNGPNVLLFDTQEEAEEEARRAEEGLNNLGRFDLSFRAKPYFDS